MSTDYSTFRIAHELGHFVIGHGCNSTYKNEVEANHFASYFLCPQYANKIVRIAVTLLRKGEFFDKNYKDKRFINKHKYKAQGLVEIAKENSIEIAL